MTKTIKSGHSFRLYYDPSASPTTDLGAAIATVEELFGRFNDPGDQSLYKFYQNYYLRHEICCSFENLSAERRAEKCKIINGPFSKKSYKSLGLSSGICTKTVSLSLRRLRSSSPTSSAETARTKPTGITSISRTKEEEATTTSRISPTNHLRLRRPTRPCWSRCPVSACFTGRRFISTMFRIVHVFLDLEFYYL